MIAFAGAKQAGRESREEERTPVSERYDKAAAEEEQPR